MSSFAHRCGVHDATREAAAVRASRLIQAQGLERVRLAWCDPHGTLRGKTLTAAAAVRALREGVSMVSTLLLKDTSDRTAFKVFEPGGTRELPGLAYANNLLLLPEPDSLRVLPWTERTGWLRCDSWTSEGTPVALDARRVLQGALARLAGHGLGLRCGLEIEFHIYRLRGPLHGPDLDPAQAAWPGPAPEVSMLHPGYQLLSEAWGDLAEEPLRIVQRTAQGLGLPLASLEVEMGPSQFEAVFDATDALTAADNMALFRSATRQALRRHGYYATFMCRPPFDAIMSSGWHLHQSLYDLSTGANVFMRAEPAPGTTANDAQHTLSALGAQYLAGLLAHAPGTTALCTPTVNGYGRFRPNALAPQSILWGRDNRGAMLRVVGEAGDSATRIENRLGEPAANPYLYLAANIHAGLAGVEGRLTPPPATEAPYAADATSIPTTLGSALDALRADPALRAGLGDAFIDYYCRIKQLEQQRFDEAEDKLEFQRREYFGRL